jgi:hypothetical protein
MNYEERPSMRSWLIEHQKNKLTVNGVLGREVLSHTRVCPKVSGLSHNEIYAHNNKHSLRSNTKSYGGKIH